MVLGIDENCGKINENNCIGGYISKEELKELINGLDMEYEDKLNMSLS